MSWIFLRNWRDFFNNYKIMLEIGSGNVIRYHFLHLASENFRALDAAAISSSAPGPFILTKYPPALTNGKQSSLRVDRFATARDTATSKFSRSAESLPPSSALA